MGCLRDRVGEISNFTFCKFNVRGVQARVQVVSLYIAISFAVAILYMKDSESLQEASEFVLFPLHHFVQPILMWIRGYKQDTNKLELPKNSSSIVRLSHECNVTIFLLFAIGISLRWIKLIGFCGGGGKKGVNYICTV